MKGLMIALVALVLVAAMADAHAEAKVKARIYWCTTIKVGDDDTIRYRWLLFNDATAPADTLGSAKLKIDGVTVAEFQNAALPSNEGSDTFTTPQVAAGHVVAATNVTGNNSAQQPDEDGLEACNIGGVAELPDAATSPQQTPDASSLDVGLIAGAAAGGLALAGAAWYARRRRVR